VSNEPDGSVAGHFEGAPDAVEALVRWCRDGPPSARVERVDVQQAEPGGQDRFTVR
jgi:acylphosphatase